MLRVSYWVLPIVAGVVWLGTIMGLLIHWTVNTHRMRYDSMDDAQSIAYISDVGASGLKPLFVAGCSVTSAFMVASFASDRWLRHRGRLVPNTSLSEKVLSYLTICFATVGSAGLVLLSAFDTQRYKNLHNVFLLLFIGGYLLCAVFICWEYQRLGIKNRDHRLLRLSFWIKLVFILGVFILAVAFVATNWTKNYDAAAILEWAIAFVFTFYALSFFIDLFPASYTRDGGEPPTFAFRTKGMPAHVTPQQMREHQQHQQQQVHNHQQSHRQDLDDDYDEQHHAGGGSGGGGGARSSPSLMSGGGFDEAAAEEGRAAMVESSRQAGGGDDGRAVSRNF